MAGARSLLPIAHQALDELPQGWTGDVRILVERWGSMRFAVGRLSQPHLESTTYVSLRAVHDHRIGIAAGTDATPAGLKALARAARSLARVAPPDAKFPDFPSADGPVAALPFSAATAQLSPERQVGLAEAAIAGARSVQPEGRVAGIVNVGHERVAVANTSGLAREAPRSVVQMSVLVDRPDLEVPVSGWDEAAHWDAAQIDPADIGRAAARRVPTTPTESAKPGPYRVLLSGSAWSDLLGFLGHLGFNSRGDEEGWSCLRTRRGRRIAPSFVSLVDDGTSPASLPRAFDMEGTPKRPVPLIDRGVAGPPVVDLRSAAVRGTALTGHGPLPESPWGDGGASPANLVLAPGEASFDDLVRAVGDGILVTRLHYIRTVHPARSILTGMTRDGTYRIHQGEVGPPVRNLRFTESVLASLASLELLGQARRAYADERGGGATTTPAAVVGRFHFTSATLF